MRFQRCQGGRRKRCIELTCEAFLIRLDGFGETVDCEGLDWNFGRAVVDHLGERITDAGAELKAVAAEAERVQKFFVVRLHPITGSMSGR